MRYKKSCPGTPRNPGGFLVAQISIIYFNSNEFLQKLKVCISVEIQSIIYNQAKIIITYMTPPPSCSISDTE